MKKVVKIVNIIVITLIILCTVTSAFVYAQEGLPVANEYEPTYEEAPQSVIDVISMITTIIQTIGVILSVVILLMIGIKYMIGSVEERADYKKTMIPFLVGCVMIFDTSTIVKLIANLTSQAVE